MTRALLLLVCVLVLAPGCVQRRIHVTSEPSGALVHLNDEEVGRTPVTVPFTHYGTYDVRLALAGHEPLWTTAKAQAPWWEYPGPDLIAEAIPNGRSDVRWHFTLEPQAKADDAEVDRLIQTAELLRRDAGRTPGSAAENSAETEPARETL